MHNIDRVIRRFHCRRLKKKHADLFHFSKFTLQMNDSRIFFSITVCTQGLLTILINWGCVKMAAILQTTLSITLFWTKMFTFPLRFHWSLFPEFSLNNKQALFQKMDWRRTGNGPLSEPMMAYILLTHIFVVRPRWVMTLLTPPYKAPYLRPLKFNVTSIHLKSATSKVQVLMMGPRTPLAKSERRDKMNNECKCQEKRLWINVPCADAMWYQLISPGQNGHHFTDDIFRCIFVKEKCCVFIKISLKFVPKGPMNNIPELV